MMPRYKLVGLVERPDHKLKQFRGDEIVRTYHSMGEVASMFGVAGSQIRFYEDFFQLIVKKDNRGHRQFSDSNIATLRHIIFLCDRRLKLEYVRYLLRKGCAEIVVKCLEGCENG